ncbi:imidazole glycerol phosphate synthase subunit HisH [Thalassospiraceae bacterium LMO-JJ14]|nr:imidazole glycerol phosphate synthase subunit HisH [Thalassospiraceae bacterium LMO-JJ14]
MIGIIDYGLGNLRSVLGAVEKLGHKGAISANASTLMLADKLILPGVGAFGDGMRNLDERGLIEPLNELVQDRKVPILGICLGFQLLGQGSEEFGEHAGLGWIPGTVKRIRPEDETLRVPHVGWNDFEQTADCILFDEVPDPALFYFVHSYHLEADPGITVGTCTYGTPLVAAVQSGNVFGTQFHPEKSQQHGLKVMQNFLERA